jgi:hypothetical protein
MAGAELRLLQDASRATRFTHTTHGIGLMPNHGHQM